MRRILITIPIDTVVLLDLTGVPIGDLVRRPELTFEDGSTLPADAKIIATRRNRQADCVDVICEHESFAEVAQGVPFPQRRMVENLRPTVIVG